MERLVASANRLAWLEETTGLSPLGTSAQDWAEGREAPRAYEVGDRLWRLGYLERQEDALDAPAREAALRVFQDEADITVDGWVGPETWERLNALVSLEETITPVEWGERGHWNAALWRGIHLRLLLYGMTLRPTGTPEGGQKADTRRALRIFREVMVELRILAAHDNLSDLVCLLFDQERLIRRVGQASFSAVRVVPPEERLRRKEKWRHIFIRRLAQTELWAQGYEVGEFGQDAGTLKDALHAFWEDRNHNRPLHAARRLTRRDFRELAADVDADEALAPGELEAVLQDPSLSAAVADQLDQDRRRPGMLWDGIQRAGRWLKKGLDKAISAVKRGARKAGQALRQMGRWLWAKATDALSVLRAAQTSFLSFLGKPIVAPDRTTAARIGLDLDVVGVHGGDAEGARAMATHLRQTALGFSLACELLALVFDLVGLLAAPWTAISMLATLVKRLRGMWREGQELLRLTAANQAWGGPA